MQFDSRTIKHRRVHNIYIYIYIYIYYAQKKLAQKKLPKWLRLGQKKLPKWL